MTFSAYDQTFYQSLNLPSGDYTGSLWVKGTAGQTIRCRLNGVTDFSHTLDGDWQEVSESAANGSPTEFGLSTGNGATGRVVEIWHPQHEAGMQKTPYQSRVNDYDITEAGQRNLWFLQITKPMATWSSIFLSSG